MLHETLNPSIFTPSDWRKHIETYDSLYVEGMRERFLIRRKRLDSLPRCLYDIAKAYQTAQRQRDTWDKKVWNPLWDEAKSLVQEDGEVLAHAKVKNGWWLLKFSESEGIGWGWSFSWVDKPKKPLNLDFGQRFHDADDYSKKFSHRTYVLGDILKGLLNNYIYKLYSRQWLEQNRFSNKILRINLRGDQYWYKIGVTRGGQPTWENFIWQSNKIEEITL